MFAPLLLKLGLIPKRIKIAAAIALIIALGLALAYCSGRGDGKRGADLALEKANTKTVTRDTAAREVAADERLADEIRVIETKKELSDVVAKLPDKIPSDHRIALGCERLRRQGTDTSIVPACRGR